MGPDAQQSQARAEGGSCSVMLPHRKENPGSALERKAWLIQSTEP